VLKFYESNDSTIINIVSLQFFNKFILVQSAITFIKQFHMWFFEKCYELDDVSFYIICVHCVHFNMFNWKNKNSKIKIYIRF